jgi:alanyl-tRNA synthetase
MTANILREKFLIFFKARKHKVIDSDSLVPKDDPTVLFTPAGMNQFKKEFMGQDCGFKRATTSQRCLRTDDLDKVGKTSAHHTFFEMLGNFSFGDYFKAEAIAWAWEFLTKELKIPVDKLWVSVYQDDSEAFDIWKNAVKIPVNKIIRLGDKDNFWPAEAKTKGPNGPCGPCSEIFYDFGPQVGCGEKICDPSCSCGRFVEIWNLVFTQFNRKEDGSLEPLPNKNIDTGMGLERLTAVMQGKQNNFQTELFQPIINEIVRGLSPEGTLPENKLLYAIADHLRAVVFSIYDGIVPSNEGRGYIVRKIIRKSVLHLRSLGINKPYLYKLVGQLAQIMHKPYPDLKDKQEDIARVILEEEKSFTKILEESEEILKNNEKAILDSIAEDLLKQPHDANGKISASATTFSNIAWTTVRNYDTYGIPTSLSIRYYEDLLEKKGLKSHPNAIVKEIESKQNELRDFSKSKSKMKGDVFSVPKFAVEGLPKTEFLGYNQFEIKAKVLKVINNLDHPDLQGVVLDKTVFYAESGGQVNDIGTLSAGGNVFSVVDVQKTDNVFIHWGRFSGFPKAGDVVDAEIDTSYRMNIARNHTATHLLQAALRQVLGNHVQQQGSLVTPEKLRFDFTHFKGLSAEEITRIEEVANGYLKENCAVDSKEMDLKEAKKAGALAFFEEKYGENVRVVAVGNISKELCGGTHLTEIKQIGLIKIISESSVASGIRRIEAVTDKFAEQFIKDQQKKAVDESEKRNMLEEIRAQEKQRSMEMNKLLPGKALELSEKSVMLNGKNTVFSIENNLDMNALRILTDLIKGKLAQAVIALGSQDGGKASLVVGVTADLCGKGLSAKEIILVVAPLIGGSGGGREDFAQAGGNNPANFALAFDKIKDIIIKL